MLERCFFMNEIYVDNMYLPHILSFPKGLMKSEKNPYQCGAYFEGDEISAGGWFFAYSYKTHFTVSICDFHSKQTCRLWMPPMKYIALRGAMRTDGKVHDLRLFMEEDLKDTFAELTGSSRIAYVEVEFYSEFYEQYMPREFPKMSLKPTDILGEIRDETVWPHEIIQILNDIKNCAYKGALAELYYIAKCNELMSHILHMGSRRISGHSEDIDGIKSVIDYIDANYEKTIRQDQLVLLARMSGTKLRQLFKQITGYTITDYISRKKSEKAASLLTNTDMTVNEISAKVGFLSPTGFAISFKKQFGVPPRTYRKNMRYNCMKNPSSKPDIVFGLAPSE
jgi:AraC-like DNA-binding protein